MIERFCFSECFNSINNSKFNFGGLGLVGFGLVGLVWYDWFGRFGLVGSVWHVWFGRVGW